MLPLALRSISLLGIHLFLFPAVYRLPSQVDYHHFLCTYSAVLRLYSISSCSRRILALHLQWWWCLACWLPLVSHFFILAVYRYCRNVCPMPSVISIVPSFLVWDCYCLTLRAKQYYHRLHQVPLNFFCIDAVELLSSYSSKLIFPFHLQRYRWCHPFGLTSTLFIPLLDVFQTNHQKLLTHCVLDVTFDIFSPAWLFSCLLMV